MAGPLILFRTPYFRGPVPLAGVPDELRHHFTTDQARLREADAVVFHIPDWRPTQLDDTPKYPGQLWVLWSMESAVNYPRMADPDFLRHFDLSVTYERTADIWSSYLPGRAQWQAALAMPPPPKTETAPLVMFQSALIDGCGRNAFSGALMRQIPVDSYGRVYRNRTLSEDFGRQSKLGTISRYHFCLSLENSLLDDYVTEKLFDPLLAGTVPVYRGAPNAREFAPEHSFIDAEAYGGPRGLADYLRHLLESPGEYAAYFAWRQQPLPDWLEEKLTASATSFWLRLLERVDAARAIRRSGRPALPFGIKAAATARAMRLLRQLGGRRPPPVQLQ
ncbi:hypothetical protein VW23_004475 [Devosia insulae DS-56]|uniref:Uncharacterized protein n=1 Tax=Devosia insulae DS-56 TaxID=1116389 RepID=A0A1E5XIV3_9HYPH|nr:hypothetical protein VW23_004475 [Devosia insulae DS-56]